MPSNYPHPSPPPFPTCTASRTRHRLLATKGAAREEQTTRWRITGGGCAGSSPSFPLPSLPSAVSSLSRIPHPDLVLLMQASAAAHGRHRVAAHGGGGTRIWQRQAPTPLSTPHGISSSNPKNFPN